MKRRALAMFLGLVLLTAVPVYADDSATGTDLAETPEQTEEQIPAVEEKQTEVSSGVEEAPAEAEPVFQYTSKYKREEDGTLKLDEQGDPIPNLLADATQKPVAWLRDELGELVLDANRDPIPTQFADINAEKIATIEDVLNPNRSIDIYASWEGDALYFGAEARLTAALRGYDNVVYTVQWETSKDGANWRAVEGANATTYALTVTEENYMDFWRVRVTVTGVDQEAA